MSVQSRTQISTPTPRHQDHYYQVTMCTIAEVVEQSRCIPVDCLWNQVNINTYLVRIYNYKLQDLPENKIFVPLLIRGISWWGNNCSWLFLTSIIRSRDPWAFSRLSGNSESLFELRCKLVRFSGILNISSGRAFIRLELRSNSRRAVRLPITSEREQLLGY